MHSKTVSDNVLELGDIDLNEDQKGHKDEGDDVLVMNDSLARENAAIDLTEFSSCYLLSCCNYCCYKSGCCGQLGPTEKFCCPPVIYLWLLAFIIYTTLGLNLLAEPAYTSPFWGISPGLPTLYVFCFWSFLLFAWICWLTRNPSFDENAPGAKKLPDEYKCRGGCSQVFMSGAVFFMIYMFCGFLCYLACRCALYPGMCIDMGAEEPPDGYPDNLVGEEFTFKGFMEVEMKGYKVTYSSGFEGCEKDYCAGKRSELPLTFIANKIYPVVSLWGQGGSGWNNPGSAASSFLKRAMMKDPTIAFEVYSYSFRGYEPNDNFNLVTNSQAAIEGDTAKLYDHVMAQDSDMRPMVFSHSMGTGPAGYLAAKLRQSDLACMGMGMPAGSITQVALEMSMYSATFLYWAIDSWETNLRIKSLPPEVPFVVTGAGHDKLISFHNHEEVYEASASEDKLFMAKMDGGHNDVYGAIQTNGTAYDIWFKSCLTRA